MEGFLEAENEKNAAFSEGWLLTGDQGWLDTDGYLYLQGRRSERINRGGMQVMPAGVDAALLSHPAVREATAFPIPHPTLGNDLVAAVVLQPGTSIEEEGLRSHALTYLAAHEVPSRILVVDALPKGKTGKVERHALAKAFATSLLPEWQEPLGELEQLISKHFGAVLKQQPPGRNSNFFMLGGDSLSGQRIVSALGQELALDLSPTLLFIYPTVQSLAEQLDRLLDEALAAAEAITCDR
jgi:acyl carrier protein